MSKPDASTQAAAALVVYGIDGANRPRAAFFRGLHASLATKAARLMGLNAIRLAKPAQRKAAEQLPEGKVYANGRGLIPFVRRGLLDQVLAVSGRQAPKVPKASPAVTL